MFQETNISVTLKLMPSFPVFSRNIRHPAVRDGKRNKHVRPPDPNPPHTLQRQQRGKRKQTYAVIENQGEQRKQGKVWYSEELYNFG